MHLLADSHIYFYIPSNISLRVAVDLSNLRYQQDRLRRTFLLRPALAAVDELKKYSIAYAECSLDQHESALNQT